MTPIIFDPNFPLTIAAIVLSALAIISLVALRGWRDWIALKRDELTQATSRSRQAPILDAGFRIELADIKERLCELEAIAAGVDI